MAMIPALCDSCGLIFGCDNLIGGNVAELQMQNSKIGPCPFCGSDGSTFDGVYDMRDGTLKVVSSSGLDPSVLQGVIATLEALKRGEVDEAQAIEKVEREAPELAQTVRQALGKPDRVKWLTLLIAMIGLYLNATAPSPPTASEIAEELQAQPVPTYIVPAPKSERPAAKKASAKKKRPGKQHGKVKQRRGKKRR